MLREHSTGFEGISVVDEQGSDEAEVDEELAGACALVHDLVSIPKDHKDRSIAGEVSALALGVVAINELVAPVFFRRALLRAGEAKGSSMVEERVEGASASM